MIVSHYASSVNVWLHNIFHCVYDRVLNFNLLKLIVIRHCHQYKARPACTSMQSDQALNHWLANFKTLGLISLKLIMDNCKKTEIKKFSRLRVNTQVTSLLIIHYNIPVGGPVYMVETSLIIRDDKSPG